MPRGKDAHLLCLWPPGGRARRLPLDCAAAHPGNPSAILLSHTRAVCLPGPSSYSDIPHRYGWVTIPCGPGFGGSSGGPCRDSIIRRSSTKDTCTVRPVCTTRYCAQGWEMRRCNGEGELRYVCRTHKPGSLRAPDGATYETLWSLRKTRQKLGLWLGLLPSVFSHRYDIS